MKFKEFRSLEESKVNTLELIFESESTVSKLQTLQDVAQNINSLEIHKVFGRIKDFLNYKVDKNRLTDLQKIGFDIVKDLEISIKQLLVIKRKLQTKYLDSLIGSSGKLVNNIKDHIDKQVTAYNNAGN